MNKLLLLTSASVLVIGVCTQAGAVPAEHATFEDLCGETVSVNTIVAGTDEYISATETCAIELANDVKLAIKDSYITYGDEVRIFGEGTVDVRNSPLEAKIVGLNLTSGDIVIRDSSVDVEDSESGTQLMLHTGSGSIDLRNNDFMTDGDDADMEVNSGTGDIDVVGNYFNVDGDLGVDSSGGNVEFKTNSGFIDQDLNIDGDEVTVKNNDVSVSGSVSIEADNALQVKDNDFNPTFTSFATSTNGPCDIKDNTPVFSLGGNCI